MKKRLPQRRLQNTLSVSIVILAKHSDSFNQSEKRKSNGNQKVVLEAISGLADFVKCHETVFLYMLAKKTNAMR